MCKPASEGGQRCAANTRKALAKAKAASAAAELNYREASVEDQPLARLASLGQARAATTEALFHAMVEHASTPSGRREYEADLAKAQADGDGFAVTQASGVLLRGAELRERNKAVAGAVKAAAAKKATRDGAAPAGDHAVCNACGWEGPEGSAPGGTCPTCSQDDVNYFHRLAQATKLSEDEFEAQYGSICQSHIDEDANAYWDEPPTGYPADRIWTVVENHENENHYLLPGTHYVNRLGYIASEKPWTDPNIEVLYFDHVNLMDKD